MEKTSIEQVEGAYVLKFKRFSDDRGYFQEVQSAAKCDLLKYAWQINVSSSNANVVRGMHVVPFSKLCTCVRGALWDVVADVRKDSPTYGNWFGVWLTEGNCKQLFIPAGCAHGFYSKCDQTLLLYSQDGTYNPKVESEVNWRDTTLNIEWPLADEYLLSDKDKNAKFLI
jgi:dTDP-4-dehydrorhamnose 3,5-epimerase